ncbi:MAG: hypothetical protein RLZZ526_1093 [Actinomycetota bacterium]
MPRRQSSLGAVRLDVVVLVAVLVMVAGFIAVTITTMVGGRDGDVYEYTIPAGTAREQARGAYVPNLPPPALALRVNDELRITNLDSVAHTYSFLVLRPGETGTYKFRSKGVFVGDCTVGQHPQVSITVT